MSEDPTHGISSDDPSYWALEELHQGKTNLAAEVLLSGDPVHPYLLAELGDLLLGDHETHELRLCRKKMGAPKKRTDRSRDREMLEYYEECEQRYEGEQKKALIGRVADKFFPNEVDPARKVYASLERARKWRAGIERMRTHHLSKGT